jgi:hypothetical protein
MCLLCFLWPIRSPGSGLLRCLGLGRQPPELLQMVQVVPRDCPELLPQGERTRSVPP